MFNKDLTPMYGGRVLMNQSAMKDPVIAAVLKDMQARNFEPLPTPRGYLVHLGQRLMASVFAVTLMIIWDHDPDYQPDLYYYWDAPLEEIYYWRDSFPNVDCMCEICFDIANEEKKLIWADH